MKNKQSRCQVQKYQLKGCFLDSVDIGKKQLQELANVAAEQKECKDLPIDTNNFLLTVSNAYNFNNSSFLVLAHFYANKMRLKFYHQGEKKVDAFFVANEN